LSIDLPVVSRDSDLSRIVDIDELTPLLNEIHVKPDSVTQLVAFGDIQLQSRGEGYYGAILQGNYNAKRKLQELEETGWKKGKHAGEGLYHQQGSTEYIAGLSKNTLCLGTLDAVKDLLDVKRGKKKPASNTPTCNKLLSCFSENRAPVEIYMMVPQDVLDMGYAGMTMLDAGLKLISLGSIRAIMGKIGLVHGLGMTISHSGEGFPVELSCLMQNEGAASLISGSLNLLKGIASMVPPSQMSPQERQNMEAFNSMRVTRRENMLMVSMIIPRREFLIR